MALGPGQAQSPPGGSSALLEISPAAAPGPSLLAVDVGFSKTDKSSGMAWRVGGTIGAYRTGSGWTARQAALPPGVLFDLAAFDAPLVQAGPGIPRRGCEAVYYLRLFAKRCRPGISHFGHGLTSREAGALPAEQFLLVIGTGDSPAFAAVVGAAMVEAFPSAFMGVLLPDEVLASPPTKRGGKSDRL